MPGIEARAPERTETSSGLASSPKLRPVSLPTWASAASTGVRELGGIAALVRVEIGADFGGDGEARRHRQAEVGHFGEVGPLAAEQVAHRARALGLAVAEGVDPLRHVAHPGKRCILETGVPRRAARRGGVGHVPAGPRLSRRKSR